MENPPPQTPPPDRRFGGIERLYGAEGLTRLKGARAMVVGIGGVGSWVAEALARSAVGTIHLVDLDDICESNINRQIHAQTDTVGTFKVEAMAERVKAINPACEIIADPRFFTAKTAPELFATPDPSRIRTADLADVVHDPLLARVRKRLRQDHGFPRAPEAPFKPKPPFGIPAVFSDEPIRTPEHCDAADPDTSLKLDCETGYGTVSFVTGSFGFFAAALAVNMLADASAAPPTSVP